MEGWKLVPKEPTREMKIAMCEQLLNYDGDREYTSWNHQRIQRAYYAALNAAPQAYRAVSAAPSQPDAMAERDALIAALECSTFDEAMNEIKTRY